MFVHSSGSIFFLSFLFFYIIHWCESVIRSLIYKHNSHRSRNKLQLKVLPTALPMETLMKSTSKMSRIGFNQKIQTIWCHNLVRTWQVITRHIWCPTSRTRLHWIRILAGVVVVKIQSLEKKMSYLIMEGLTRPTTSWPH